MYNYVHRCSNVSTNVQFLFKDVQLCPLINNYVHHPIVSTDLQLCPLSICVHLPILLHNVQFCPLMFNYVHCPFLFIVQFSSIVSGFMHFDPQCPLSNFVIFQIFEQKYFQGKRGSKCTPRFISLIIFLPEIFVHFSVKFQGERESDAANTISGICEN